MVSISGSSWSSTVSEYTMDTAEGLTQITSLLYQTVLHRPSSVVDGQVGGNSTAVVVVVVVVVVAWESNNNTNDGVCVCVCM